MKPDLLMLDEPTNHLDLPSIEWLEKYLLHYQGAVIIVSHDKYFLDRMVNKVVELYQRKLHFYTGNYTYYQQEKEIRIEMQQRAFENQQDFIRQQERFIERFKAKASKAAQAQSVQKRLDKIERVEEASIERPNMRINFSVEKTPGKVICTLKNLKKNFGPIEILNGTDAEIERGDKIALIGANGKGKSTLLRIIADRETFEGERNWGHNVAESFYAQHQLEHLKLDNNLVEELQTAGSKKTDLELRTILGCFLFSGDDVDKKIRVLSGGEKARVALAKTIISKSNFLMLDEPTNHLDMHSVDLLSESLNNYEGSLILVSHDRYFISKTANKIWEIVDGKVVEFKGGYEEWVEWKERMEKQAKHQEGKTVAKKELSTSKPIEKEKSTPIVSTPPQAIDKEKQKEKKKLQRQFEEIEQKTAQLKQEKIKIESDLANPEIYSDISKFQATEKKYNHVIAELTAVETQYEKAFELLMSHE
jgi:ATP-binding cassette subfamily F protein 3